MAQPQLVGARVMEALTGWGYSAAEVERLLLGDDQHDDQGDEADHDAA